MQNTIIFLQKLLNTTTDIPMDIIPCNEPDLTDYLTRTAGCAHEGKALWKQLQQTSVCEVPLPEDHLILFVLFKPENTVIALGPTLETMRKKLYKISELTMEYLNGRPAEVSPLSVSSSFHGNENISQMRQVEMRYEYSAAMTNAIQQGNLSLAMHLIENYNPGSQTTVRNTNPLRNAQNYCIVLNTQLRHALEKSGIHPFQVDKLSNEIGIEIEQLTSTDQLPAFFADVIRRYCRLVQEHAYPNLKPLANLAVTYIKEHLADNLTVKDTAKALTINANYLSTLFHKDMGITFIDFVNKERTNQAAALLRHTNLQIQQIAATVGYNNTSYFAKQFLRFQGVSPSTYRQTL